MKHHKIAAHLIRLNGPSLTWVTGQASYYRLSEPVKTSKADTVTEEPSGFRNKSTKAAVESEGMCMIQFLQMLYC